MIPRPRPTSHFLLVGRPVSNMAIRPACKHAHSRRVACIWRFPDDLDPMAYIPRETCKDARRPHPKTPSACRVFRTRFTSNGNGIRTRMYSWPEATVQWPDTAWRTGGQRGVRRERKKMSSRSQASGRPSCLVVEGGDAASTGPPGAIPSVT